MPRRRRATSLSAAAAAREAYRILRSNLLVSIADLDNPVVIITSAVPNEGKTSTCARLAVSLAQAGLRIVVVDLDLRHPDVHLKLGVDNDFGVTDVLLERRSLEECLQYIELPADEGRDVGLYFLGTGPSVGNPTEVLGTRRTHRLLENLAMQADLVLLDTPPVLPVADTLVVGRMAGGAVLVVEAGSTASSTVLEAKDALTRNQTRLLGVVLNKVDDRTGPRGYGYGYGYGAEPDETVEPLAAPSPGRIEASEG